MDDLSVQVAKESDLTCEENFLRTTMRDDNGRKVVRLPVRDPENENPPSVTPDPSRCRST